MEYGFHTFCRNGIQTGRDFVGELNSLTPVPLSFRRGGEEGEVIGFNSPEFTLGLRPIFRRRFADKNQERRNTRQAVSGK
jgi:hypothetical protein